MIYRSVTAVRLGSPGVLQITEHDLREPAKGEVRIKTLAASVCRPDVTVRSGQAPYTGTPLGQKTPFVPGYAIVGEVDAIGEGVAGVAPGDRVGVLTVTGGYSEYVYRKRQWLIPIPSTLDPAEDAPLILNYLVAHQVMHRSARVKAGDKVLIIGASGGIGTALLQLGSLAGLTMYGLASPGKHAALAAMGAIPMGYHTQDFAEAIRQAEPDGLDAVFDGMSRIEYIHFGLALLRRGGQLVSFGEPASFRVLFQMLATLIRVNLLPSGRSFQLYGTSTYFLFDKRPFLEDWAALFRLLEAGAIRPVIAARFPILEAAKANALLESGTVTGNLVLLAPELL